MFSNDNRVNSAVFRKHHVDDDARARDAIGDARDDARTRGETTRRCGQSGGRRRERVETDGGDETELGE